MEPWSAYEAMGAAFAEHAADGAYNAHYDRPAVLAVLGPVDGLAVLDAGCGPGLYGEELVDGGARVTGFDASQSMVDLARHRLGDRARIDRAVLGEPLPYADDAFDAAICALVIHHVADRAAAFAELHRVVHPGGVLVVSTVHPTADWLQLGGSYFDTVQETETWEPFGDHPVTFWREPLSALTDAATGAGWLIERLVEPRPVVAMCEQSPQTYARLQREPGFLVLRLRRIH